MSYNTKTNSWNDENKMALFVRPEIKKKYTEIGVEVESIIL